jgi:hypothetical protein
MMKPTNILRWKVPPGTSTQPPVLQQLWEWEFHHDYCSVQPPTREWRDVPFQASANNEYSQNSLSEKP